MSRLSEQQALVERKALEVERARAVFADARANLVAQVKRCIGSPAGLLAAFGVGFAWGGGRWPGGPLQVVKRVLPGGALPGQLLAVGNWFRRLNATEQATEQLRNR